MVRGCFSIIRNKVLQCRTFRHGNEGSATVAFDKKEIITLIPGDVFYVSPNHMIVG